MFEGRMVKGKDKGSSRVAHRQWSLLWRWCCSDKQEKLWQWITGSDRNARLDVVECKSNAMMWVYNNVGVHEDSVVVMTQNRESRTTVAILMDNWPGRRQKGTS
jgi:hypothetical protein